MEIKDYAEIVIATIAVLTFIGTAYNTWQHKSVMLVLAEVRLNMMREMNGKYLRIESFNDLKDRVKRLEGVRDEH